MKMPDPLRFAYSREIRYPAFFLLLNNRYAK